MAAASSIGEAISLQRRDTGDYWLRRLAEDMRLAKAAEEKKKEKEEEELASLMDFKIDYSKYLPAYAKKITGEYANMINNIAKLRQDDPNVSHYALKREVLNAKDKMNSYVIGNQMAMDYLKNDKIKKDNDFSFALTSGDSTLESLSQMSNPGFYVISPTGSFNYRNVPNEAYDAKWGNPNIEKPTGNTQMVAGTKFIEFQEDFDPITVSAVKQRGKDDPVLRMQTLFDLSRANSEYRQKIDQGENDVAYAQRMAEPLDLAIDAYLEKQKPGGKIKYERGYQTEGGGDKDKVESQLYKVTEDMIDKNTGEVYSTTKWESTVSTPFAITLNSNGAFYDKSNNRWIPSEIGGRIATFNFRPTQVQIVWTRDPKDPNNPNKGSWKKYAVGSIYRGVDANSSAVSLGELLGEEVPANERQTWNKTYTVAVPLEDTGVMGLIKRDKKNDLTLFNRKYEELTKGGAAAPAKGGGGYTPAQEQGIKNVMQRNGITRDEAIQALKAANKL